jgi:hypothetical protein
MEDNLVDFNSGTREDNPAPANNEKPKSKIAKNFAITFFGVSFVYGGLFFALSHFGVPFIWSISVGFVVGMMSFAYWDSLTPGNPQYSKPILLLMLIIFILSVTIHYSSKSDVSNSATQSTEQTEQTCETLTMSSPKDHPMTSKCYHAGEQVKVIVYDNPVKIVCGEVLSVGSHVIPITSDGRLCFHSKSSAKVEVF